MEDFVPFELSKKLKEKGFNYGCIKYYDCNKQLQWSNSPWLGLDYNHSISNRISAPTIPQVLKWLREKYATHIEIALGRNGWYFEIVQYEYYEEEKEYDCKIINISVIYNSYELAALAGIEYCLDNLI